MQYFPIHVLEYLRWGYDMIIRNHRKFKNCIVDPFGSASFPKYIFLDDIVLCCYLSWDNQVTLACMIRLSHSAGLHSHSATGQPEHSITG